MNNSNPLACPSLRSASWGSACGFHCFDQAVTAAGALSRVGGSFIPNRPRHEAVRSGRPGALRGASGHVSQEAA